jgi:hypothetical protein
MDALSLRTALIPAGPEWLAWSWQALQMTDSTN